MATSTTQGELHAPAIAGEFRDADFGDDRLTRRLVKIAESLAQAPAASIPVAMARRADEDATYRFLSNEAITADATLQPHREQTLQRVVEAREVICIHDTTELEFPGEAERQGMGRLGGNRRQGFYAHISLAVTADGTRRPLGVLSIFSWARTSEERTSKKGGKRRNGTDYARMTDKESQRWSKQVQAVDSYVGSKAEMIHVMDREGDAFTLLLMLVDSDRRFVVRMAHDRIARADEGQPNDKAWSLMQNAPDTLMLEVPVSARAPKRAPRANETSGARVARIARLAVRARTLQLRKPRYLSGAEWLPVNLVEVYELDPPVGEEPIDWLLVTHEPIDTIEQVRRVVEIYRTRWLIEEFFKALKMGCAIEKRQLETFRAMVNLLAIMAPIAWQMLLLRSLARDVPDAPAEVALTPTQIEVLREFAPKPLPPQPNVRDALFAVAGLGGHYIKRDPGWIVLGRGMEKLLLLEAGWSARKASEQRRNL